MPQRANARWRRSRLSKSKRLLRTEQARCPLRPSYAATPWRRTVSANAPSLCTIHLEEITMSQKTARARLQISMPAPNLRLVDVEDQPVSVSDLWRSEERRVGKECRSRWSADH